MSRPVTSRPRTSRRHDPIERNAEMNGNGVGTRLRSRLCANAFTPCRFVESRMAQATRRAQGSLRLGQRPQACGVPQRLQLGARRFVGLHRLHETNSENSSAHYLGLLPGVSAENDLLQPKPNSVLQRDRPRHKTPQRTCPPFSLQVHRPSRHCGKVSRYLQRNSARLR